MAKEQYSNNGFKIDEHGFLQDIESWGRPWVEHVAKKEELGPLTDLHWRAVVFQNMYYNNKGRPAMLDVIRKHLFLKNIKELNQHIPNPAIMICKLAGLPNAYNCG